MLWLCRFLLLLGVLFSPTTRSASFVLSELEETPLLEDNANVKLWALLVAGSSGWDNYRHQADVCHAYQVLHNHGIPDDRIVVMMYDDIAFNEENPTPGVVINHINGSNVYLGVPVDYSGQQVTPENFLNVLQGRQVNAGSGKVIASGPRDHVFVFFSDHGAPGLLCFPEANLMATQLSDTIKTMAAENRFGKMVLYIEACESGSIFDGLLPDDINVYATTAANPNESSYACYYDALRNTYLGDLYSVSWMEDSDREDLRRETLLRQFQIVKAETNTSHVMEYGDMQLGHMKLSAFQGRKETAPILLPRAPLDLVDSRDVPVEIVRRTLEKTTDRLLRLFLKHKLDDMKRRRLFLSNEVADIAHILASGDGEKAAHLLSSKLPLKNRACYESVVKYFDFKCFKLSANPYALGHLHLFVNLCEENYYPRDIRAAMDYACTHGNIVGIV
ncbi:legumain, putative [Ixodes scapularis]|uniref:legumain n=1 Tax=Ixodes scapularis TaxID=6945 RepID=B7P2C6_IXOSC|nr:legumain, putative [Ixodes scapularis]|eukprot:XP_002402087.1 legumain, putative [Ixodes scapularis]